MIPRALRHVGPSLRTLLASAVLASGCMLPDTPPSDDDLRNRFEQHKNDLEALRTLVRANDALQARGTFRLTREDLAKAGFDADAHEKIRAIYDRLTLDHLEQKAPGAALVIFTVWIGDIVGPGFQARGFAYAKDRPANDEGADRKAHTIYTPLGDGWYLYDHLID
jgi:hypothetical protein